MSFFGSSEIFSLPKAVHFYFQDIKSKPITLHFTGKKNVIEIRTAGAPVRNGKTKHVKSRVKCIPSLKGKTTGTKDFTMFRTTVF